MSSGEEGRPAWGDAPRDPEELVAATEPTDAKISAHTMLGAVHLTVAELKRSLTYYRTTIGLDVLEQSANRATLGAGGRVLLVLVENEGAQPGQGYTGLYHFALLVPQRPDLARWLAHAARDRVALVGLADHFVSEALYLTDPDGHGIEIYWDRPREVREGQVATQMTTLPLDADSLLGELVDPRSARFAGLPAATVMGHVHLKVASIDATVAFYRDVLGFGLMAQLGAQAAFFGAGGTTIISALTHGTPRVHGRRRQGSRRCGTRRSSCPTLPNATGCSPACRSADGRHATWPRV